MGKQQYFCFGSKKGWFFVTVPVAFTSGEGRISERKIGNQQGRGIPVRLWEEWR
ncbi:MAG: hypothetical protein AB7D47_11255 [Desulfovibrio sp.]|jgi:hypothetical protein